MSIALDTDFFPSPDTLDWQKAVRSLAAEIRDGSSYELSIHPSKQKLAIKLAKEASRRAKVKANITTEIISTSPSRWGVVIEPFCD